MSTAKLSSLLLREDNARLRAELEQKTRYISTLEDNLQKVTEKLMVMLDPVNYNQYKLANRIKSGPIELTEEEKKKIADHRARIERDHLELQKMGILAVA